MKQRLKSGDVLVPARPFQQFIETRVAELETDETCPTGSNTAELGPVATVAMELFGEGRTVDSALRRMYKFRHAKGDTASGKNANGRKKYMLVDLDEFPRSIVENALHRVNPDLFMELYPQFAHERDIVLEPDAWCPHCRMCDEHPYACPKECHHVSQQRGQWVTPSNGLCPFCECEHGHLFREVGITDDGFACLACAKAEHRAKEQDRRESLKEAA